MANITAAQVKELRDMTAAGMMDCKQALQECDGDVTKAVDWLRRKGMSKADKKATRTTSEGRVGCYIHHDKKQGAMVELLCETDFVARNEKFEKLLNDLCMQVVAMAPLYIAREDVPAEIVEKELAGYRQAAIESGKPEAMAEKIANGQVDKFLAGKCLLEQDFVLEDGKKVKDMIKEAIGTLGENIKVGHIARFKVGE